MSSPLAQFKHDITLYAAKINLDFLREHGVTDAVKTVELQKYFEGDNHLLLNTFLLPQLWRQDIAKHDVYHCHVWPNQYVDLHPMVWLCHEPLRSIYDLRYEQARIMEKCVPKPTHLSKKKLRQNRNREDLRSYAQCD